MFHIVLFIIVLYVFISFILVTRISTGARMFVRFSDSVAPGYSFSHNTYGLYSVP